MLLANLHYLSLLPLQFYLSCVIDKVDVRVKSAGVPYVRPLSSGQQSYDSVPAEYPVTEPMPKLSALQQTSGEAVYTTDIPTTSDLLHGAFVLAPQGNAKIVSVDTSAAQVSVLQALTVCLFVLQSSL